MKKYEITFIVGENYTEDKAKEIAKNVRELIEKEGGKIDVDLFWGKKKLVYKIAKNTFGYYFVLVFFIEPAKIAELNKELKMNERVIRYLIVDFVEKTPFFEEVAERKARGAEGRAPRKEEDVIEENLKKSARKRKERVVDGSEVVVEKVETTETPITDGDQESEIKRQEEGEASNVETEETQKEEGVVEAEEETKEEIPESPKEEAETKEELPKEIKEEKKEEGEKPKAKKDTGFAERKSEKSKMSDDDRKAQLEKKLAELLREEEEE